MLLSLLKNWARPRLKGQIAGPVKLHIGGQVAHPEWKIYDVRPGPLVDFVGDCTDLSAFDDESVTEIYASHVLEHLGYMEELPRSLREFYRVMAPGGTLRASVPDLEILCMLIADPALSYHERFHVMRMLFGGQSNSADFHKVGLNEAFLHDYLLAAGFVDVARTNSFQLFDDSSALVFKGRPVSLNLSARKPLPA
jgi:predicted SAM-dependent methyltransferase